MPFPMPSTPSDPCHGPSRTPDRRSFLKLAGSFAAGGAATTLGPWPSAMAGPFARQDVADHFVPADKKLRPDWVKALFSRGERTWYSGADLETIGMPVGGVAAGQVYLTGDGRLVYWDIFNSNINTGFGSVNYKNGRKPTEMAKNHQLVPAPAVDQGFALRIRAGGSTVVRSLDAAGFPAVRFAGEYPIGYLEYPDPALPVQISLEAFSPFIPLQAADSSLPATLFQFTLRNAGSAPAEVTLAGWLQNAVALASADRFTGRAQRSNRVLASPEFTAVLSSASLIPGAPQPVQRPPVVFADFEGGTYGDWKVEGEAFGAAPAGGTLRGQQEVSGFRGQGLVNTFLGGDRPHGKLTSPVFRLERPFLSFLIGGGAHGERTCMNLLVDGRVVRTASGSSRERLAAHNWNVRDLLGKEARLEIVDAASEGWGHINVDQIEFRDTPLGDEDHRDFPLLPDTGTLALALLGPDGLSCASLADGPASQVLFPALQPAPGDAAHRPMAERLRGAVGRTVHLAPGQSETLTFAVAWHLPNLYRGAQRVGNHYASRFADAAGVVGYLHKNLDRLTRDTRLWHDTYYDASLPWWLLDRIGATVCNLATTTAQWWQDGRFWAWEGCGCCHGTCGHVWNYAHALARLFPELERSVRERQDFAPGIGLQETGAIGFRGENSRWAGDAQGGYILKAWREHQCSADGQFLSRNWPQIKRAMEFLIREDGNADGLLEGMQHQTYDQEYYGANTFVGSLYLGALRAAEEMAREAGDPAFAQQCRQIFEAGRANSARLFNGEYYIQQVDLAQHPDWQYAAGCLADQMFGQGWAHQTGLGYLYPRETVLQSLASIWKYDWAPDIGPQNEAHQPERWFAFPGEAGLFTCTWPLTRHLGPKSTRYRDEIWTGIEYQVANHMAWEGMLTEALALCRAVHDRYHPSRRNPYNEIECGDHYARALASWGMITSLSGFEYHGPKAHIGFAPRLTPERFHTPFTAAGGWGTYRQRSEDGAQKSEIAVKWGSLRVRTVALAVPEGRVPAAAKVTARGRELEAALAATGARVLVTLKEEVTIHAGEHLEVTLA